MCYVGAGTAEAGRDQQQHTDELTDSGDDDDTVTGNTSFLTIAEVRLVEVVNAVFICIKLPVLK